MKNSAISLICLLLLSFNLLGGDFDFLPFAAIDGSWQNVAITVKAGGLHPDVMQLLKAFHAEWPTQSVQSLIDEAGDRRFVTNDVTDCEDCTGHVFVDCDDFNYASFDTGEPGSEYINARTYQRENGHTLFGICLQMYGAKEAPFCCFYDYNPSTQVMTPEDVPYGSLRRKWKDSILSYHLGMAYDQTIIVTETSSNGEEWFHHYAFNGMKHIYHHSGKDFYHEEDEEDVYSFDIVRLPEEAELKDQSDVMELFVNIDGVGSERGQWSVWLRNKDTGEVTYVFATENTAEPRWEQMRDGNGIAVPIDEIAAGDCYNSHLIPWDADKIFVEGCPDDRNVWSYIIDFKTREAIQLPTNEGLIAIDPKTQTIHMSNYQYLPEGGRYSMERVYTIDGKFTGKENRILD